MKYQTYQHNWTYNHLRTPTDRLLLYTSLKKRVVQKKKVRDSRDILGVGASAINWTTTWAIWSSYRKHDIQLSINYAGRFVMGYFRCLASLRSVHYIHIHYTYYVQNAKYKEFYRRLVFQVRPLQKKDKCQTYKKSNHVSKYIEVRTNIVRKYVIYLQYKITSYLCRIYIIYGTVFTGFQNTFQNTMMPFLDNYFLHRCPFSS